MTFGPQTPPDRWTSLRSFAYSCICPFPLPIFFAFPPPSPIYFYDDVFRPCVVVVDGYVRIQHVWHVMKWREWMVWFGAVWCGAVISFNTQMDFAPIWSLLVIFNTLSRRRFFFFFFVRGPCGGGVVRNYVVLCWVTPRISDFAFFHFRVSIPPWMVDVGGAERSGAEQEYSSNSAHVHFFSRSGCEGKING